MILFIECIYISIQVCCSSQEQNLTETRVDSDMCPRMCQIEAGLTTSLSRTTPSSIVFFFSLAIEVCKGRQKSTSGHSMGRKEPSVRAVRLQLKGHKLEQLQAASKMRKGNKWVTEGSNGDNGWGKGH